VPKEAAQSRAIYDVKSPIIIRRVSAHTYCKKML